VALKTNCHNAPQRQSNECAFNRRLIKRVNMLGQKVSLLKLWTNLNRNSTVRKLTEFPERCFLL